jgi:cation:H+ antiporter
LVVVHSVALGGYGALAFDGKQAAEIWLTAAQSFFAIAVLVDFEVTVGEAVTLLTLFLSQVLLEFLLIRDAVALPVTSRGLLLLFTGVYVVLGAGLFAVRRDDVASLVRRSVGVILGRERSR